MRPLLPIVAAFAVTMNTSVEFHAWHSNMNIRAAGSCAASLKHFGRHVIEGRVIQQQSIRMDDEVARKGIKEELTTRDAYLATRFTRLSTSGHDLTPMTSEEVQAEACSLSEDRHQALFDTTRAHGFSSHLKDNRDKGLYACVIGGLPLFTSGWKLEPRDGDQNPSFAEPCDEDHIIEEWDVLENFAVITCARSRLRLGHLMLDKESSSGRRYIISAAALDFHPLGKALPVRCQPENYWGSEGQYRAWVLE